jgi:hypothetical protein
MGDYRIMKEIFIKPLENVEDPREFFDLVMAYADKTKRNPWKCLGEVLNSNRYTVIIYELDSDGEYYTPIGYANAYVTDDNDLFIHHGYMDHPSTNNKKLLEDICTMIQEGCEDELNRVIIHSTVRLWKKYGFEESKEKIYIRDFPKGGN